MKGDDDPLGGSCTDAGMCLKLRQKQDIVNFKGGVVDEDTTVERGVFSLLQMGYRKVVKSLVRKGDHKQQISLPQSTCFYYTCAKM